MISQSELVNLEDLVAADHLYRVYKELLDFESLMQQLTDLDSVNGPNATHLISKSNLWKERDQALKEKHDKLNNDVLPKVAADKQARIGCKGKDKYWYGYKQHTST